MTELNQENGGGVYKVKVISPYTFSINCDTTNFKMYETGGYANEKKVPFYKKYKPFSTSLV